MAVVECIPSTPYNGVERATAAPSESSVGEAAGSSEEAEAPGPTVEDPLASGIDDVVLLVSSIVNLKADS